MNNYALVDISARLVVNTIVLDNPVSFKIPQGFIVIGTDTASIGWSYIDEIFHAPHEEPLSNEKILARNKAEQDSLLAQASQAMAPILVSLQLGNATDQETVLAREWQEYYRALKIVDISAQFPVWPSPPGEQ